MFFLHNRRKMSIFAVEINHKEMINREIIRIKIVQLTYAYYQNGNKNIDTAEKELIFSLSKAYDLYNYLLALIVAVSKEAQRRLEILETKALREGTVRPSTRFAYNRFSLQLAENKQLCDFISSQKWTWADEPEFIGKLFEQIEQSQLYKDYMAARTDDYAADRELWRRIYRTFIQENSDLEALLEEQSLYWNDDKEVVDTFVLKTIKRFSYNWDFSRLAYMDVVIMQIAIAELMTFPSIPVSVTINEFVDIAKLYSTPKSGSYINGMLDTIARHLIDTGRLMKRIDERKAEKKGY